MRDYFSSVTGTLEDRLKRAALAYRKAADFIGPAGDKNIADVIRDITPSERAYLADLYEDINTALKEISVPPSYYTLLDDLHIYTTNGLIQGYRPRYNPPDFCDRVTLMQGIADRQAQYWSKTFPETFIGFYGTTVKPFLWDEHAGPRQDEFSLWPGENPGHYYYRVSNKHSAALPFLLGIAAHEPEHAAQQHLARQYIDGSSLPQPLREAAQIFSLYERYGVSNLPPGLFYREERPYDRLGRLARDVYVNSPHEKTALYLGQKMENAAKIVLPYANEATSHHKDI